MRVIGICLAAFAIIAVAWVINPGLGILVALLTYGAVNGLVTKE